LEKLERINVIKHKHGQEIYVINSIVINVLWKGVISCLWVHAKARTDVGETDMGEKSIKIRCVTF
jgi:hypothetical protein